MAAGYGELEGRELLNSRLSLAAAQELRSFLVLRCYLFDRPFHS